MGALRGKVEAMLASRPRCGASRKPLTLLLAGLVLLWLCWAHLSAATSVAYAYGWWALGPAIPVMSMEAPKNATLVPKIIHQTWKDKDIPEKWRAAQKSCIDLHPDFEYRLWTDEESLRFIELEFPWFLPTYLAYPYVIQRVDAIRYFILYHHGGVYIDLDMGCRKRVDPLLAAPFTAPLTHPVGISNDVMAAAPGAAFMHAAVHALRGWNLWLVIKYVQVMFTTGPMFLTVLLSHFPDLAAVAVISKADYGKYDASGDALFYHLHGSSWHAGDAPLIFWMERYGKVVLLVAVAAAALIAALAYRRQRSAPGRPGRRTTLMERQCQSKYGDKQVAYCPV